MSVTADFTFSDTVAGYVRHSGEDRAVLSTLDSREVVLHFTDRTSARLVRNLGEPAADVTGRMADLLVPGQLVFSHGPVYPGPRFTCAQLTFVGQRPDHRVFDDPRWWTDQLRELARFYRRAQFGDGPADFDHYRTGVTLHGDRIGNLQETDTISRLVYGMAAGYLLTGDEELLDVAERGSDHLRRNLRFVDGDLVYWYHGLEAGGRKLFASEFTDDHGAIPAYEQIYALAGPVQTYRVTGDPALRADIDALPLTEATGLPFASTKDGVAHACGHDAHTTILLAAAMALATAPELPGRIRLIFQHAEEVMPGGALDVLSAGALDGVDRIFGLHCDPRLPVGKVGVKHGALTSAADLLEVRLNSPGGHTSRPHLTADLVHALGTLITGLPTLLSRRVDPRTGTVLTWGAVHAGEAPNAIPQNGVLTGTLRTGDRDTWAKLEPLVHELVHSLLSPLGVGFDLKHHRGVPPVVNDAESTEVLRSGIAAGVGEQALSSTPQSSGGEDFGWYLEHVPGSFARLGVHPGSGRIKDLHQPTFDLDERALLVGVRVMVATALAALQD